MVKRATSLDVAPVVVSLWIRLADELRCLSRFARFVHLAFAEGYLLGKVLGGFHIYLHKEDGKKGRVRIGQDQICEILNRWSSE